MDRTGAGKSVIIGVLFLLMAVICNAGAVEFVLEDLRGSAGRVGAPASYEVTLTGSLLKAAEQNRLVLQQIDSGRVSKTIAAQFEPQSPGSAKGKIWWLMPSDSVRSHRFRLSAGPEIKRESVSIDYDKATQQMNITEGSLPVLRYNYGTVGMTEEVKERFKKGAYPSPPYDPTGLDRGDYIHPLYGPEGEVLTDDYPVDHPHHRGIYWSWPEVYYKGELRDIHAVFGVWARPVKVERLIDGPVFALIQVENVWMWKNTEPIVKEKVSIRAFKSANKRRFIDLEFSFTGLADGVQIARRGKNAYGGLNFRMAGGDDLKINFFTDPETVPIRRAWADMANTFKGGRGTTGITILQNMSAPAYPNDWIEYPNVFWYQPGFPPKGQTYKLTKDNTLILKHRLWIHPAQVTEDVFNDLWTAYNYPPQPKETLVQYRHILNYKFGGSRKPLIALENIITTCPDNEKKQIEAALLEVIDSKQATNDIKHWICTQLNIIGTDKSVPSMAILLTDKSLCHSARYALDGIRTALGDKALRDALKDSDTEIKTGIINSIGVRQDAEAVEFLAMELNDKDSAIVTSALVALGKIGSVHAAQILADAKIPDSLTSARTDALLDCAQSLISDGDKKLALKIYSYIYNSSLGLHYRSAALWGIAKSDQKIATKIVTDIIVAEDESLFPAAMQIVAEVIPGSAATVKFTSLLDTLPSDRKIVLLGVLAERDDDAALQGIEKAVKDTDSQVSLAAIKALTTLGNSTHVKLLADIAAQNNTVSQAAYDGLCKLRGGDVGAKMADMLQLSNADVQVVLIKALAERRCTQAVPQILKQAKNTDDKVRRQAITATGILGEEKNIDDLMEILAGTSNASDIRGIENAIASIFKRIGDKQASLARVLSAVDKSGPTTKASLYRLLSILGGKQALKAVVDGLKDKDESVRQAAFRSLTNWTSPEAASVLLGLAADDKTSLSNHVLALRGYVRLANMKSIAPDQKIDMLQNTLNTARRPEEKKLALSALSGIKTRASFKLAAQCLEDNAIRTEAAMAVINIACPQNNNTVGLVGKNVAIGLKKAAEYVNDKALSDKALAYIQNMPRPDELNLAFGKTAKGSVPHQGNSTAQKAVDGVSSLASFWSGSDTPSWLSVDLEDTHHIDNAHVAFYWDGQRYYQYTIDVSSNEKDWKTVVDMKNNTAVSTPAGFRHSFDPTETRFVRVYIHKNSANPGAHIVEFKVYEAGDDK